MTDSTEPAQSVLSIAQRDFVECQRIAHFASADRNAQPHVVPVCYCLIGDALYFSIDEKPKHVRTARLKRLRNIIENPKVSVVIDRYDEDWTQLAWVMLRGEAGVLDGGREHALAQQRLRERYHQYQSMDLQPLPVVAIRIQHAASWGALNDDMIHDLDHKDS